MLVDKIYPVIRDTLRSSLSSVFLDIGIDDVEIIYSHQNGLEPDNTYCVLNILNMKKKGFKDEATFMRDVQNTEESAEEVESVLETITHYGIDAQLSFLGTNASESAWQFKHMLENNHRCYEILQKANIGLLERSDIRRAPQKRDTQWVDGANMDICFSFAIYTRFTFDWVEYIVVQGEPDFPPITIKIYNEEGN